MNETPNPLSLPASAGLFAFGGGGNSLLLIFAGVGSPAAVGAQR
jgi:hypothetical protein